MVYDIHLDKLGDKYSILPDRNNIGLMYRSKVGFNKYLLCQTTELAQTKLFDETKRKTDPKQEIDIFETDDPYRHP